MPALGVHGMPAGGLVGDGVLGTDTIRAALSRGGRVAR